MFNTIKTKENLLKEFYLILLDLYFLIHAVIEQIFHPIAELVIPIGISIKEAEAEMETHPVIAEAKIRNV